LNYLHQKVSLEKGTFSVRITCNNDFLEKRHDHNTSVPLDLPFRLAFMVMIRFGGLPSKNVPLLSTSSKFSVIDEAHGWGTRSWDIPKIRGQGQDSHLRNHTTLPIYPKLMYKDNMHLQWCSVCDPQYVTLLK